MKFLDKIAYRNAKTIEAQQISICAYKDTEEFEDLCRRFGGSANYIVNVFKLDNACDIFAYQLAKFIKMELRDEAYPYGNFYSKLTYIYVQKVSISAYRKFLKNMHKKTSPKMRR